MVFPPQLKHDHMELNLHELRNQANAVSFRFASAPFVSCSASRTPGGSDCDYKKEEKSHVSLFAIYISWKHRQKKEDCPRAELISTQENHPSPAAPSHLESLTMSSSSPASNGARDSPASGRAQSSSVSWHACARPLCLILPTYSSD